MPTRGTTKRSIRINGELWAAAAAKAEQDGTSISEVLRSALETYVGAVSSSRRPRPPRYPVEF